MPIPYKGANRYRTFLKAGRIIAGKIATMDGVVGVLGTGSIGRRFGDRYSDLDMTVYAHTEAVRRLDKIIAVYWTRYKGMDFDIPVVSYERALREKVPSAYWSQLNRWHVQNSQILYDTDNRLKKLLDAKLVYPDREQKRLLDRYQSEVHEHLVFFPVSWAERGELYNVVDALVRAVQSMVLWIYARNKVFEPFINKWLFYHLEMGTVPEAVHLPMLTEVYTSPLTSIKTAMHLRDRLLNVCDEIGLTFEVYSYEEAHRRGNDRWKTMSKETRRVLSW
jgi:hypothetical protein